MLFLFNATVLDLMDAGERLASPDSPFKPAQVNRLTKTQVVHLVSEAVLASPNIEQASPEKAALLASVVAVRIGANAMIAIAPPNAKHVAQVATRFAEVSLTTLGHLHQKQLVSGPLSTDRVNRAVWLAA